MMIPMHRSIGRGAAAWRPLLWAGIGILLVAPWVAMRFTPEIAWDAADFLAATLLLVAIGLAIEVAARLIRRPAPRFLAIGSVILCGALIWADAAVGIF